MADNSKNTLSEVDRAAFKQQLDAWKQVNSKAKLFFTRIDAIEKKLALIDDAGSLAELQKQFRDINAAAASLGVTGKNLGDIFTSGVRKMLDFLHPSALVMSSMKKMATAVYDIDTAMTGLYKTTDEAGNKFNRFLSSAKKDAEGLGLSLSGFINRTSAWSGRGFSLKEAEELARVSSLYSNISGTGFETAMADISAAMDAFNIKADSSVSIVDKLASLGKKYGASAAEMGAGLNSSASALAMAGNSIDESLALIAAMTEITHNASESASALQNLSMRIRSCSGETGSCADGAAELAKKLADLTRTSSTPGGISLFTDDTGEDLKSTYQLLHEISGIWKDLSESSRAGLLEALTGNQDNTAFSALLSDMTLAERAFSDSLNSGGSAYKAQEQWLGSLEAKTAQFEAAFQSLSATLLSSDLLKFLVDLGTAGISTADSLAKLLTPLGTLAAMGGGVLGTQNLGKYMQVHMLQDYCFEYALHT